jgi:predicted acyl esterase
MKYVWFLLFALFTQISGAVEPPSPPKYEIELKEAWIPMPDGVRLAADLYMPVSAKTWNRAIDFHITLFGFASRAKQPLSHAPSARRDSIRLPMVLAH